MDCGGLIKHLVQRLIINRSYPVMAATKTRRPLEESAAYGRIGAHKSWSRTPDRAALTAPGRNAANDRFYKEVDPEGVLPPDLREKMAAHARKAHCLAMAEKSKQGWRPRGTRRCSAQAPRTPSSVCSGFLSRSPASLRCAPASSSTAPRSLRLSALSVSQPRSTPTSRRTPSRCAPPGGSGGM